jgi:hypothetical protein
MGHSPGPWRLRLYRGHKNKTAFAGEIIAKNGTAVYNGPFAFWSLQGRNEKQAIANAKLMAASPELLEALKILRNRFAAVAPSDEGLSEEDQKRLEIADDAIAKATGK